MQLSILTSILQSRVRYAAQSRVLDQVPQQQQINSVLCNNNTATCSLCVLCSRRGIVDYDVIYTGPQREIFPGGTEFDAGPTKLSEALTDNTKKVFSQIWSYSLPKIR